ncbi:PAPA-1-like conserved region-domain-containing protein [Phellopilus nigrolimitatus]|nr:PAPA-1-like conserved region-domain-containing protein [Phellopilus nigrolimitatus]
MPPTRRSRQPPREPVIEIMEVDNSGEDMDVSEEDVPAEEDAVSSEAGRDGAVSEDESHGGDDQEDEIEEEDEAAYGYAEYNDEPEEDQEDELSSSPPRSPPPKPAKLKSSPAKPRLKIKLKFSGLAPVNVTPTPSDEMPLRPGRKGHPKHVEVESEDDDDASSTGSASYAGPTRMTHRQAALAGMVESSEHLELEEAVSKKKKHLNETEMALKREETARKRKNLSVKKLEDEKTETINRLLKKQSRARGKKLALVEPDEDAEQDAEDASTSATPLVVPTLFRWVSSSKPGSSSLSFSVPPALLPDLDPLHAKSSVIQPLEPKPTPICDVKGCTLPRKYKVVKDPTRGGCGMEHLKALQVN